MPPTTGAVGGGDLDALELDERVAACVRIKADVVASDEREGGRRAILNYGHTLAHAIETASDHALRHGEAVAIGLLYAAEVAYRLGRIDAAAVAEHRRVIGAYELRSTVPDGLSDDELIGLFDKIQEMKKTSGYPVVNPMESLREMQRHLRGEKEQFGCLGGHKYFYLDWHLNLYRCHFWEKPMCNVYDWDDSKLIRDGCTRCMIDCYRDPSVLQFVAVYNGDKYIGYGITGAADGCFEAPLEEAATADTTVYVFAMDFDPETNQPLVAVAHYPGDTSTGGLPKSSTEYWNWSNKHAACCAATACTGR